MHPHPPKTRFGRVTPAAAAVAVCAALAATALAGPWPGRATPAETHRPSPGLGALDWLAALGLGASAPNPPQGQVAAAYGQLPLSFEPNQGQTVAEVKFLARGPGYALFLTPAAAVLTLQKPKAPEAGPLRPGRGKAPSAGFGGASAARAGGTPDRRRAPEARRGQAQPGPRRDGRAAR